MGTAPQLFVRRLMRLGIFRVAVPLAALYAATVAEATTELRDITVKDSIEMTRWANPDYLLGADAKSNIANFSPDAKHFVIVLRKANLARNVNVYSIHLFTTSRVFDSAEPHVLIRMSSSSNAPAIKDVKWLKDNHMFAFIGIREPGVPQVYTLDTQTGQLKEKTHHRTAVDQFDISSDGKRVLFTARPRENLQLTDLERKRGVVIENQTLEQVLTGHFHDSGFQQKLFFDDGREREIKVPVTHQINPYTRIFFSPDGRYASFTAFFRQTSPAWTSYQNEVLKFWGRNPAPSSGATPVSQFFLFDCVNGSVHTLLNAPATYSSTLRWAADSRAVYLKTFLPLDGVPDDELREREVGERPVEISVSDLSLHRMKLDEWNRTLTEPRPDRPQILVQEDLNTPPRIVAEDRRTGKSYELIDLNPQFSRLKFGRVEVLHLSVDGVPVLAGTYLPPDYAPGKRYPLVIQTHGFDPNRFSMDGRDEWSSGFAARPLAAGGVIVVQMESFANPRDHDKVGNDRTLGGNLMQSFRNFSNDCDKQVVRELAAKGLIDLDRVGISAFSRTVWFVSYLLTHSSEPKFRTAILTDGVDAGYFQYIAGRQTEFNEDNGGKAPFDSVGMEQWMNESPGFDLSRVAIPLRLVSIEDRLAQWEWFVSGKMQNKPVELIEIPGGSHILERPRDRQIAMQGIVDWFRFWLQDYVDTNPVTKGQYTRWGTLKSVGISTGHVGW